MAAAASGCGPSRPLVVCLGDSLTEGYSVSPEQAYPALLQARVDAAGYGYQMVNAGFSGDAAADGLARLDETLYGDVRILVLALGTNDGLQALPVDEMRRTLETIIRRARERGIDVLLVGSRPPRRRGEAYLAAFTAAFESLAREHDLTLVPDILAGVPTERLPDRIHPDAEGQRIVADNVWRGLEPMLARLGKE